MSAVLQTPVTQPNATHPSVAAKEARSPWVR